MFCAVIEVIADTALPPSAAIILMSACMPAPPLPSEPVMVRMVFRCCLSTSCVSFADISVSACTIQRKQKKGNRRNIVPFCTNNATICIKDNLCEHAIELRRRYFWDFKRLVLHHIEAQFVETKQKEKRMSPLKMPPQQGMEEFESEAEQSAEMPPFQLLRTADDGRKIREFVPELMQRVQAFFGFRQEIGV